MTGGRMCADDKGGIGAFAVIGIVFVLLKLTGEIDWSWWWVTAPIWGPYAIGMIALIVLAGLREAQARQADKSASNKGEGH